MIGNLRIGLFLCGGKMCGGVCGGKVWTPWCGVRVWEMIGTMT